MIQQIRLQPNPWVMAFHLKIFSKSCVFSLTEYDLWKFLSKTIVVGCQLYKELKL